MSELGDAALAYAARGWEVFPLHGIVRRRCTCGRRDCSSPGKHPLVRRGLHQATTDQRVIKEWWRPWRCANIALATGAQSGIVVIDIDLAHRTNTSFGSPGEESQEQDDVFDSLARLLDAGLPRTLTGLTGGGGVHLFYARPGRELRNHVAGPPGSRASSPASICAPTGDTSWRRPACTCRRSVRVARF